MKKMMVLMAVAVLALPALALGATATAGKYTGKITSLSPDLNNKTVTADVKNDGSNTTAKVTYTDGTSEEWNWNDKTLTQKEFDKAGKVTQTYTATLTDGKYFVNCKDKAKNECDAGIDARNYWTLNTTPNGITYEVYGVSKDKKNDATAKAEKRHTFAFQLSK